LANNKTSYNNIARQWSDKRKDSFVSRLVLDFADKTKSKGHILDLGCGTGFPLAKYLSDRGFSVTGLDFSDEMIAIAKGSVIEGVDFVVNDFFDFATKEKFDGILAWDSLWHFPKDKQKSIYAKMNTLLNADGYLLFTHGKTDGEHVDTMMGESFYYSALSEQDLYKQLRENGFEIEYAHHDFIENDSHRAFVVLAKKM